MLPKSKRLKTSDFKDFRGSRTLHSPHFILRLKEGSPPPRIAAVVSNAVAKKAVDRNRLRRRVYTLLRNHQPPLKAGLLTITAKKGATGLTFEQLRQEINIALAKIPSIHTVS